MIHKDYQNNDHYRRLLVLSDSNRKPSSVELEEGDIVAIRWAIRSIDRLMELQASAS